VAPRWRNREKFDYRIFETPTRKSSTPDFFDDFNGFRGYKRYGFRGFSVRRILFQGILGRFFAYRRVWRRPRPSYGPEPTGARQMYVPKPSTPSWQVYLTRRPAVGRGALSLLRRWCSGGKKPSAQRFSTLLLMLFTIISNAKPVCVAENWSSTHLLRHHRDAISRANGWASQRQPFPGDANEIAAARAFALAHARALLGRVGEESRQSVYKVRCGRRRRGRSSYNGRRR
jgi:hypothetical protein